MANPYVPGTFCWAAYRLSEQRGTGLASWRRGQRLRTLWWVNEDGQVDGVDYDVDDMLAADWLVADPDQVSDEAEGEADGVPGIGQALLA